MRCLFAACLMMGLACCLWVRGAAAQEPLVPVDPGPWFEVESTFLSFGEIVPDVDVLPKSVVVRVHSDRNWVLRMSAGPGTVLQTGEAVPANRMRWRVGGTSIYRPFDPYDLVVAASGGPTTRAGELVEIELLMDLEDTDPTGEYRYAVRLFAEPLEGQEAGRAGERLAFPQERHDETISIMAVKKGVFECTLDVPDFDFGDVDVRGTDYLVTNVVAQGRNPNNTGGLYLTAPATISWTCRSSPPSDASFALNSSAADHVTGGMNPDALEVRVTGKKGNTTGFQPFTSGRMLLSGLKVTPGKNAQGDLDLRLTVFDNAPSGRNVWIVRLRVAVDP